MSNAARREGVHAERLRVAAALRAIAGVGDIAERLGSALPCNDTGIGAGVARITVTGHRCLRTKAEKATQIIAPGAVHAGICPRSRRKRRAVNITDDGNTRITGLSGTTAGCGRGGPVINDNPIFGPYKGSPCGSGKHQHGTHCKRNHPA
ncbi:hypothetical protein X989_5254 [Burkholderia pseudomallei MSHR4378]|nr:hypothetical protein X989_5254 [Burkholderia pseudomallei MSHR4378]